MRAEVLSQWHWLHVHNDATACHFRSASAKMISCHNESQAYTCQVTIKADTGTPSVAQLCSDVYSAIQGFS